MLRRTLWFIILSALLAHHAVGNEELAPELASLPDKVVAPKDNPTTPAKVALGKQLFFTGRSSDVPGGFRVIDQRGMATPAVGIGMLVSQLLQK